MKAKEYAEIAQYLRISIIIKYLDGNEYKGKVKRKDIISIYGEYDIIEIDNYSEIKNNNRIMTIPVLTLKSISDN